METPIKVFMDSGESDVDPDVPVINATFLNTEGEPVNIGAGGQPGPAGAPGATYTLPKATTAALGGVKMANAVADPTATTQSTLEALSGDSVAVADVNNVITQLNTTINNLNDAIAKQKQLLANLRSAGIIGPNA